MFFQEDYTAQEPEENLAEKTGGRRFLWVLGQETAAVLKLNLLFLLCCLPVVTIPPALLALHRSVWTLAAGSMAAPPGRSSSGAACAGSGGGPGAPFC